LREHPPVDIIAFHRYAYYPWGKEAIPRLQNEIDHIKEITLRYGYKNIPIVLTETSLLCNPNYYSCPDGSQPEHPFYYAQANYLVDIDHLIKCNNLIGWIWYPLPNGGWYDSGLLYTDGTEKPVYRKYLELKQNHLYITV
jgi:hypothetical protein